MDSHFRPNLLLREELDYELKIRGVFTESPVIQKRKILLRALNKERESKFDVLKLTNSDFDFQKEKDEIESTLDSIKVLISDFEGPSSDSVYLRARTRLLHLTNRILRVAFDGNEDNFSEKQRQKNEWYASAMLLDAELHEKVKEPNQFSSTPVSHHDGQMESSQLSQTAHDNTPLSNQYFKPTPVHKLGISFGGDPKQVMSFIERVEETARARHIPKAELFESASDLFSEKAIFWLRLVKPALRDWDSLVEKLKADFLNSDVDDETWREIRMRKQGRNEPVVLFIATVEGLFGRLSYSPAPVTKVKYIKRGLQKEYQQRLALQDISSVDELGSSCKRLEEADVLGLCSSSRSHQVCEVNLDEPSSSRRSPNVRGGEQSNHRNQNNFWNGKKNKRLPRENNPEEGEKDKAGTKYVCWKCSGPNHLFKDCKSNIKKRFCFKCGTPDVTSKTCSHCSGNA